MSPGGGLLIALLAAQVAVAGETGRPAHEVRRRVELDAGAAEGGPVAAYAVIVANNRGEPAMPPLHFADDDGARYRELFSLIARRVELLTVLDRDTQALFPDAARLSLPPDRRTLLETLDAVFADIERDRKAGLRTVFYFVYAGHGSVGDDGEGAMHLLDGRFTRADLFHHVIARSPARVNHVIIDACNAYLMVARRGAAGAAPSEAAISDAIRGFLDKEGLDRYPNTGVLLSTSRAADVHEWARFSSGIFSHEVRSALAGAADVTGDGLVGYDEVLAFLGAANGHVNDPRARLHAYAAPPAMHRAEPLFDLHLARKAPTVHIPGTLSGHRFLEDARGVRYADMNIGRDGGVTVTLVPSSMYFLRSDREEIRIPVEVMPRAEAAELTREPFELARRGSEALTFQRDLFDIPFGRAYFDGFSQSKNEDPPAALVLPVGREGMSVKRKLAIGAAAGAVGVAALGVVFGARASARAADYRAAVGSNSDVAGIAQDASTAATAANVLYVSGAALATIAAALWLWPEGQD